MDRVKDLGAQKVMEDPVADVGEVRSHILTYILTSLLPTLRPLHPEYHTNTPQDQTAPVPGAPQTTAPTLTGLRAPTGATVLGQPGGAAAHALTRTGQAGQPGPGVRRRRGRAGLDVLLQQQQRAL